MRKIQSGFTLMEMIVMLFVLAILAGGASYTSSSLVPSALQYHYKYKIGALLGTARDTALTSGRSVYVSATSSGIAACWISDCPTGGGSAPLRDPFGDIVGFEMPNDWLIKGLPASVRFDTDGTATGWTPITIGDAVLDIDSETGREK